MANVLFLVGSLREGAFSAELAKSAEKALEGKVEEASHPQIAAEEANHNSLRTEVSAAG